MQKATFVSEKCGFLKQPFTRLENTVVQTCVVASSLRLAVIMGYLFLVSFVGLFTIVLLKKHDSNYGELAILIFSAWVGLDGGVLAGLASCGLLMSIVSTASDLMTDFKTGYYLTLASPRSMLVF
ncbi:hypothetical protein AgCh_031659 [Apium graveolens]